MNKDNNATTRVKKYEDLRKEISLMNEENKKSKNSGSKRTISITTTIPINNNDGIDTEAITKVAPTSKEVKVTPAPIFKSYQTKKIIVTSLYIVAAIGILCLVIALIVWMVNSL